MKNDTLNKVNKKKSQGKRKKTNIGDNLSKKVVSDSKKNVKSIKKQSNNNKKTVNEVKVGCLKNVDFKKYLTKDNVIYLVLAILDIILVICMARRNVVNYVSILDEEIFLSKTRYLLYGRNYVNLVIIAFFYIYTCLASKFFLKRKITMKFLLWLFICLFLFNVMLFFIFTKKVY